MKYEKLFEPGKIGKVVIKNRVVLPPMGTNLGSPTGEANDNIIAFYEERAKGGCGLIISEITRVDEENGCGMSNQLSVTASKHISSLNRLVCTLHKYDTKFFIQLQHPGRQGNPATNPSGNPIVAPTAMTSPACPIMPHELTTEETEAIVQKFIAGAKRAQIAGVDGVELHAAHGYLLNNFLSPYTNKRTDKYGGSFENRCRIVDEIITGIHAACGNDLPVGVRISAEEYFGDDGITPHVAAELARHFEAVGASHIDVSVGSYDRPLTTVPCYIYPEAHIKEITRAVKEAVSIPVITVNNVKIPQTANQLLEEGVCDFIACGRAQLSDPEWANKAHLGDEVSIRKCIGCVRCFFEFVNSGKHMQCSVNPRLGRELEYGKIEKDGEGRHVVVVGGGPAGMQSSITLAQRGFKVTLLEAEDKLGGQVNVADKNAHKEKLTWFVETLKHEMEGLDIDVRLNTRASVESVKALAPDGVMVCFGGTHIVPMVPGIDSEKAVRVKDYLWKKKEVGHKVAIIGSGATGMETAATLAESGHDVTIFDMLPQIGNGMLVPVKLAQIMNLQKYNTNMMPNRKLLAITDKGARFENVKDGGEEEFEFDSVILALGITPQRQLAEDFRKSFENVRVIGDASETGMIFEAINGAYGAARVFDPRS